MQTLYIAGQCGHDSDIKYNIKRCETKCVATTQRPKCGWRGHSVAPSVATSKPCRATPLLLIVLVGERARACGRVRHVLVIINVFATHSRHKYTPYTQLFNCTMCTTLRATHNSVTRGLFRNRNTEKKPRALSLTRWSQKTSAAPSSSAMKNQPRQQQFHQFVSSLPLSSPPSSSSSSSLSLLARHRPQGRTDDDRPPIYANRFPRFSVSTALLSATISTPKVVVVRDTHSHTQSPKDAFTPRLNVYDDFWVVRAASISVSETFASGVETPTTTTHAQLCDNLIWVTNHQWQTKYASECRAHSNYYTLAGSPPGQTHTFQLYFIILVCDLQKRRDTRITAESSARFNLFRGRASAAARM